MPKWIRPSVRVCDKFGESQGQLTKFFKDLQRDTTLREATAKLSAQLGTAVERAASIAAASAAAFSADRGGEDSGTFCAIPRARHAPVRERSDGDSSRGISAADGSALNGDEDDVRHDGTPQISSTRRPLQRANLLQVCWPDHSESCIYSSEHTLL